MPHPNEPADIPQTGDNSRIALWFVMALVSGAVLVGAIIDNKKKESAR